MSVRKSPSLSIMSFNEALENLGLKARPPTSEELADKARQEEASREAVRAARQEEEDFAASEEGQRQAAYNQSLADAGRGHYAPIQDLSREERRFVLADQSKATERALAKELGIKLGEPLTPRGGMSGATVIRNPTAAEDRAREKGIAYTGDISVRPLGTPNYVGDILRARPTIVAEALAYPASVLGGIYDLTKQALDSNPNLSQKERLAMTVLASMAFIPVVGKAGATAKEVAEEAAKEAAKAGAKKTAKEGLKEGVEKVAKKGAANVDHLVDLKGNLPPLNADGTITLYHRTSPEAAAEIRRTGTWKSKENTGEVFLSTNPKGQGWGYGTEAVEVRVDPSLVRLDDAFEGEVHVAIRADDLSKTAAREGAEKVAKDVVKILPEGSLSVLREGDVESVRRTLEEMGVSPAQVDARIKSGQGASDIPLLLDDLQLKARQSRIDERKAAILGRKTTAQQSPELMQKAAEISKKIDVPEYIPGILPVQSAAVSRNVRGLSDADEFAQQSSELSRIAKQDVDLAKDPAQRAVDPATLELPDYVRKFASERKYNLTPDEDAALASAIKSNGGITYDMSGKEALETGYSVAPFKATELRLDPGDLTSATLRAYAQSMHRLLDVEGVHLGAWFDGKTNKYVLDVSLVAPNTPEGRLLASRLAKNGNQDAVFHLDTFDEIKTRDLEIEYGEEILFGEITPEYEALSQVIEGVTRRISPEDTAGLAKKYGLKPKEVEDIRAYHEKMVRSRWKRGEEVAQDILDQYPNLQTPPGPLINLTLVAPDIVKNSKASFTLGLLGEDKTLHSILRPDGTPYVEEGVKIVNNDVFDFLGDTFKAKFGVTEGLDLKDPVAKMMVQNQLLEEFVSQFADTKHFLNWYTDDVQKFLNTASEIFPELKNSEVHRMTLLNIASYTSNGVNPVENGRYALASYAELTQKGFMTGRNPFSVKNDVLAGYGIRGPTVEVGLKFYSERIRKLGMDGAARELLELGSARSISQQRGATDLFRDTFKIGHPKTSMDAIMPNLYGNGPKIGTYGGNLVGIPGVTYDVWMSRQLLSRAGYGSMLKQVKLPDGRVVHVDPNTPGFVKVPAETMLLGQEIYTNIARATDLDDFQIQALLWFYEQRLYRTLGIPAASGKLSTGAVKFAEELDSLRFLTPNGYAGTRVDLSSKGYPIGAGTQKSRKSLESVRAPRERLKSGEADLGKRLKKERADRAKKAAKKKAEKEKAEAGAKK